MADKGLVRRDPTKHRGLLKLVRPDQRLAAFATILLVQSISLVGVAGLKQHVVPVCAIVATAIVLVVAFDALIRWQAARHVPQETRADPDGAAHGRRALPSTSSSPSRGVVFVQAFLEVVGRDAKPDESISFTTPLSVLITRNLALVPSGMLDLAQRRDARAYVRLKKILRHYFEYTGQYSQGVRFAQDHLLPADRFFENEELWTRVKYVGYLRVLAGEYSDGQRELDKCLRELSSQPSELVRLRYYAERFLGIRLLRDASLSMDRRLRKARRKFDNARDLLKEIGESVRLGLETRLLRNYGNLELEGGNYRKAIELFDEAVMRFEDANDEEHVAIARMQRAKARIKMADKLEETLEDLKDAETTFIRLGWLEGQGRAVEQQAALHQRLAERVSGAAQHHHLLNAYDCVLRAMAVFKAIQHEPGKASTQRRLEDIAQQGARDSVRDRMSGKYAKATSGPGGA